MRKLLLTLPLLLGLGACVNGAPVQISTATPNAALTDLAKFTTDDLHAASADAKVQNPPDVTASQCYDFLADTMIPYVQGLVPSTTGTVGAVLAFQKLRDGAAGVVGKDPMLVKLNLACAPLVIDTQTLVNKLLLLGAGSGATGGALSPALGVVNSLLPIPLP